MVADPPVLGSRQTENICSFSGECKPLKHEAGDVEGSGLHF